MLKHKLLAGGKGAISLFLAVLLTPFLTVAVLLVEVQKYNSSVSILDEAMGVSSTSVLADYDDYLLGRWGLTGVSQSVDIDAAYNAMLQTNAGVLGDTLTLNSVKAFGKSGSSLSNSDVLYSQVMDFSKLNAPVKLTTDFLDLPELISSLEKMGNIGNLMNLISGGASAVDGMIDFARSIEDVQAVAEKLDSLRGTYDARYENFANAVNGLVDACNEADALRAEKEQLEREINAENSDIAVLYADIEEREKKLAKLDKTSDEYKSQKKEYDEKVKAYNKVVDDLGEKGEALKGKTSEYNAKVSEANSKVSAVEQPRREYEETLGEIVLQLTSFQGKMDACLQAGGDIMSGLVKSAESADQLALGLTSKKKEKAALDEEIDALKAEKKEYSDEYRSKVSQRDDLITEIGGLEQESSLIKATKEGTSTLVDGWSEEVSDYSHDGIQWYIDQFGALKAKVAGYDVSSARDGRQKVTTSEYKSVGIGGYVSADNISAFLDEQKKKLLEGSLLSFLKGMIAFFESLMSMDLFYDPALSAYIDTAYYQEQFGGLPGADSAEGGVLAIIHDIADVISNAKDFIANVGSLDFIGAAENLKGVIDSCAAFGADIVQFGLDIAQNTIDLFSNYDRLYYSTYTVYNLSCRTDCSAGTVDFKTMTGYNLNDTKLKAKTLNVPGATAINSLLSMIDTLNSLMAGTGSDVTFSGAELEYILFGSSSEIANQLYVFLALYLVRLLPTIPAVFANAEVEGIAAATTLGYPVVIVLYILLEPLVDTIILVNGGDVSLYESTLHLTPSGVKGLVEQFMKFGKLSGDDTSSLQNDLLDAFGVEDAQARSDILSGTTGSSGGGGVTNYLKGLLQFDYRQYCFLVMLLTVTEEQQMARLSNLIQMETLYYYQGKKAPYTFDLRNSYTFIDSEVDVSVKQMLPSLTDSTWYTIVRKQSRGY